MLRILVVPLLFLGLAAPASAQLPTLPGQGGPAPGAYQQHDGGGFRDILPPGTRGRYNVVELAAFLATGKTVPHCCDQLGMYRDLVYATPGLTAADVPKYFKDSSFGVRPGDVERTYSPRSDVTIVRDKGFGVPHVYGRNRDGAMFGLGYAGAEDRLFFMDVLRHAGRGQLSSFAGGSNAAMDAEQWEVAPYTEADLTRQVNQVPQLLGRQGQILKRDVENYVAGINRYIAEAKLDPTKLPGEYAATGHPTGPAAFKPEDLIATASLVGGIFGRGGGNELAWSEVADAFDKRFGRQRGARVFNDFRAAEDKAAPVTVLGRKRFPYQVRPKKARGVARPDPGSLRRHEVVQSGSGLGLSLSRAAFPPSASNALLISGRESASGHPLMVAGPQVAYFNPQILMEQDVHAPAAPGLPGIDAQGAAFVGINLYVQLGRGRDYAWSATSAGQDNIDTFALDLCEPDGAKPTIDSMHYRFRGACLPIEVLERRNAWIPTPGDQTPPGQQTLRAERTKLGLIAGRGTVRGKPVAFAKLRSTYFHEVDSAAGFMDFNTPEVVHSPQTFQRAASKVGYTFNWFYSDSEHIAYFNSGNNPVRAKRTNADFPARAKVRVERLEPGHLAGPIHGLQVAPARDRPALPGQLEQQAGARLPGVGHRHVLVHVPVGAARGPCEGGDPRPAQAHAAEGHRHHGAGRDDRPARARGVAARAEGGRPPTRRQAARCGRRAPRLAPGRRAPARQGPRRRLRARGRDPDHGRLVAALGARRVRARARQGGVRPARRDRRLRQRAQQPRRAPRLRLPGRLVRLRAQGPDERARPQGPRPVLARVQGRRVAPALPGRAARLAARGARRARGPALRRRPCVPEGRPVVLRRRQLPGGRRRHAAADPLDQPTHVPAGQRDPVGSEKVVSSARLRRPTTLRVVGDRIRDVHGAP
jgi:hypothetical protein